MKKFLVLFLIVNVTFNTLYFINHTKNCIVTSVTSFSDEKEIEIENDGNLYSFFVDRNTDIKENQKIKVFFRYNEKENPFDDEIIFAW